MRKKITIFVLGLIVAVLFLGSLWYFLSHGSSSRGTPAVGDLKTSVPDTNKVTVPSGTGPITVKNFLKQHNAVESGYTQFYQTDQFALGYDGPTGRFLINTFALTVSDFEITRRQAENKFLELLGINKGQACSLNVQISNFRADEEAVSYKDFPLSFCQ